MRVVAHDDALIKDLYTNAVLWSPRRNLRIDPTRSHDYRESIAAPQQCPDFPWALHLTDTDHRYRLLAFDFDTSKYGLEIACADADELSTQLTELGVQHLRTTSGPTGGQHIWLQLSDAAEPAEVKELARALAQHYLTLDISPLCNSVTGAVRGPGAPHREGGRSLPYQSGRDLIRTLDAMRTGAPVDVIGWLLARHPHTSSLTGAGARLTPIRIIDSVDGPHLDSPRRPLSTRTKLLMSTPPAKDCDRSAVAYSILLGLARTGHTLKDAENAVAIAPGLVRLREDREHGHTFTLAKQWGRALTAAATFAPSAPPGPDALDAELDAIEACLYEHSATFARPGGPSDERILHALVHLARTARTRILDIDRRRLGQLTGLDGSTISRRLHALTGQQWVRQVHSGSGTRGATWKLNTPPDRYLCTAAPQGEHAPAIPASHTLLTHHTHDLWTPHPGLGAAYARIHYQLHRGIHEAETLAKRTGYSLRTIRTALATFDKYDLLPARRRHSSAGEQQLHTAARRLAVVGTLAARALRHVTDRELWAWWNDELTWRKRKDKKRGIRRHETGTIALPIESTPRTRYGRFPTVGGRADYAAARRTVLVHTANRPQLAVA